MDERGPDRARRRARCVPQGRQSNEYDGYETGGSPDGESKNARSSDGYAGRCHRQMG